MKVSISLRRPPHADLPPQPIDILLGETLPRPDAGYEVVQFDLTGLSLHDLPYLLTIIIEPDAPAQGSA